MKAATTAIGRVKIGISAERKWKLDAIDDVESIHPVAHNHNSADRFPFALPLRDSFSDVWSERNGPQIADEYRRPVLGRHWNCFQVAKRAQIAESANHVFSPTHFKQASTNFVRTCSNFFDDRRERDSVTSKFVGVHVDLVLAHKSANGRYLRHSWNSFELVAQIPILKAPQVGQTALMTMVHKHIFINPSCAGRVRPDNGMGACWQTSRDLLHVLQYTRSRPVQVCCVFKDHKDVRIPKHSLCSHRLDVRRRKKGRDDGVSDLVFDNAGRLTRPGRVDNHFHIGNVRQRVEWNVT